MFRYLLCAGFTLVALTAQEEHGYTKADIERGGQIFLVSCANCHGPEGDALPDVKLASGRFRRASSDADLIKIIRNGIPGTPMPPGNYSDAQAQMLVAYLRSMSRVGTTGPRAAGITEDPQRGKAIVDGKGRCLECHRIHGQGGFLGPDLSEVGATRRRTDIERALLEPNADIRVDNHTVRMVGRDGKEVQARLLNQDTYSLQGIDTTGKLVSVQKASLRQFEVMKSSPMPAYKTRFSPQELADVTAYLTTLKGGATPLEPVSFDRILHASKEPQNWLTYSGNLNGQRYSSLTQINPANVKNLELQWVMQTRAPAEPASKYEATSIVADGVLYTVQPPNVVAALDAATGRIFWTYPYQPAGSARLCCGRINRGLAILGNTLFMGTIDGNLMAIDARDGHPLWSTSLGNPEHGYSVTVAPLVVKKNIIAGTAGGEYGIRGSLSAFDTATGKEVWRFNTIPGPGEPGHETWKGDAWKQGGGSIWTTGSYDPELNLIYWGIGNPGPDWNGDVRPGDNLYTSSVVALDADTGKLKWHFQFTPHDEFDFDATQVPVVADIPWKGSTRKVLLFANRNGFFYVLDRATGEFLLGKPFVKVTWTSGLDAKGRPMAVKAPTPEGTLVYPENQGGTNWYNPSYSPRTGLFYVPCWMDTYATYYKRADTYRAGSQYTGGGATHDIPAVRAGAINRRSPELGYGAIQAIDPQTGDVKWQFKMSDVTDSGVLSTASDLVFAGGREGFFYALDARTGAPLWKAMVGGQISAGPVTYMVGQTQYVSIPSGNAIFTFALRR